MTETIYVVMTITHFMGASFTAYRTEAEAKAKVEAFEPLYSDEYSDYFECKLK